MPSNAYKGYWSQINLGLNVASTTYNSVFSSVNWDHYRMNLMKLQRRLNEIIYKNCLAVPIGTVELSWCSQEKRIREKRNLARRQVRVGQGKP